MPDTLDLLVELGTEELPPKDLNRLSRAFEREMVSAFERANLTHGEVLRYATPRRLALHVHGLLTSQPERQIERRGPALSVAFDEAGNPTKAAQGFARSCGVQLEHIERLETDKGSWLVFRTTEVAQFTLSLLAPMINEALAKLPIARRMRWGDRDEQFVRPVLWAIILFGTTAIEAEILGITTSSHTRGHRFHHPGPIALENPSDYAQALYGTGHVVADFDVRREMIREQLIEMGNAANGETVIDEALLEEVTSMVEWPLPVLGSFDEEFLALPTRALIATMQGHQKYFHLLDHAGNLLPLFITISNIDSTNPQAVRTGNERVIRPRLKDAAFFVGNDKKRPLETRLKTLEGMVFQDKLGSLADKSRRTSAFARHVAIAMGAEKDDVAHAGRAALLAKCDLVTEMVGEFPELQGYMGGQYARLDGEPEAVSVAIEESYQPRFAGDAIPTTLVGRAVAVADKLDTLAGIFAVGLQPTGDKDPFALRRAALGVLRIIIEGKMDIDLAKLLNAALDELPADIRQGTTVQTLFEFMSDRLRAYFTDQGIPADVFAAVQARKPTRPFDFARRIYAVDEFRRRPEAASLTAANKRIQNILRQADVDVPTDVDDALLSEDAEWDLAAKMVGLTPRVNEMLRAGDYTGAMTHLAGLRDSVDAFFDSVKVMVDEEPIKRNRLALLNNVGTLFLQTADISELQS
ncbi:MAG: glycyl-tRNA synthetase beta chain [Gammaproteobacteria bacterium]|jgi:glycyl-tRNA synthetase beta chain